jgi:hypothetical protein
LANSTTPLLLWHGGLSLYYLSWVFGTRFDVNIQELVYTGFPRRGKVPVHGFMTIFLLVAIAAILLWTERSAQRFAIALNIFIVVDHLAWIYLRWLLKDVVSISRGTSGLKVESPLVAIDYTNLRQFAIYALLSSPNLGGFVTRPVSL